MIKRRLKTSLLLQPLGLLLLAGGLIVLFFNLTLGRVINQQAQEALQDQVQQLDQAYAQSGSGAAWGSSILSATYMIIDEDFGIHYQSTSLDDQAGQQAVSQLAAYVQEHDDLWDRDGDEELELDDDQLGQVFTIKVHQQTYRGLLVAYEGQVEDFYVRPARADEEEETYLVLIFANLGPLQSLMRLMTGDLLLILLGIGLLNAVIVILTGRRLDKDFARLATYITTVGRGQTAGSAPQTSYQEVGQLVAEVEQMGHQLAANQRSQSLFFQNASHELRTPLMSIQGYAEAIQHGVGVAPDQAAAIILTESQKMTQLVDDILSLSKQEEAGLGLTLEELELTDFLYDLTWRFKAKADQRGLVFEHDLTPGVTVWVDELLLERALSNVLANALRYASTRIWVKSQVEGDQVTLTIANDGPAIATADQERIFDRFYKGQGGQSGLGLAISREAMQRLGGQLEVVSSPEQTAFVFGLPRLRQE